MTSPGDPQASGRAPASALRAALVSTVLIGVALGRHLIKLDHLADGDPDHIVELLRPSIRSLTRAYG
ncbi:hypothetical protein NE235_24430 [Actinoallomurus spadix]|uniref:Tetracyclin repressor-like C-terminal domain-containing protein n=1 Tax=Actinoallomurus spadix TaxID=79912 RepID=A0ABP3FXT3_9ACTN|nr:hypothetical protein [Actinoallomurus spadix]MCO5989257.1 hypothetical protein [Actinoallomurus spadix]